VGGAVVNEQRRAQPTGEGAAKGVTPAGKIKRWEQFGLAALGLGGWCAALLPLTVGYWAADRLGDLHYQCAPGHRANLAANLRRVLGAGATPTQRRTTARDAFRHSARNFYDLLRVRRLSTAALTRQVPLVGSWEATEAALAAGTGVIFVFAHLGAFDSVLQLIPLRGYRASTVGVPAGNGLLDKAATALRGSRGFLVEEPTAGGLRRMLRALRRGEVIALAADRDFQGGGVPVSFCGATTTLPGGAVRLALATGALLIVVACRRQGHRHTLTIEAPLALGGGADAAGDLQRGVADLALVLERHIRASPEQWAMFQRVWAD